ncbi:uncharacterized protein LOC120071129 isoform X4 [Benincasa hispida]|uniref:uncharacterized protein LOC120071129 isoform X4 n=1 Tax=Benincasa hispida TaxID=102211 RepID=UPI0019013B3E|nr:uncharacterized protein LOC120071129 isoform X4 [Benincasa hispida]
MDIPCFFVQSFKGFAWRLFREDRGHCFKISCSFDANISGASFLVLARGAVLSLLFKVLVNLQPDVEESSEPSTSTSAREISSVAEGDLNTPSSPSGLRRRFLASSIVEDRSHGTIKEDSSAPVKLDAAAISHIEKHRKLQEDLTDEMVGLAKQLKESSLIMSKSLESTEKILDSTEKAVEDSLATTGQVNKRAVQIYSESSKTSCFTWLAIFVMTCVFVMVVLLIRVT